MGKYYNVDAVEQNGRIFNPQRDTFNENYETIVAVSSNGLQKQAGDVSDPDHLAAYQDAYNQGQYLQLDIYRISKEQADSPEFADQGRKPAFGAYLMR